MSAEMQRLTAVLDQENKDITRAQSALSAASAHANAGFTNHTIRGELLDTLAKMMSQRNQLEQQLEDDANLMQAIKDEIADLLNKLANCAPPSTTQSPGPEPQNQQPTPPSKPSPSASQTSMSTTGAGIQFQLRGFGGASFINGNTPGTSGFDGAVLFPLGNRILVGPTAGFQWINSSIVNSIGSQQPGSTFIDTSAGFKEGRFGGRIGFPFGGWHLGVSRRRNRRRFNDHSSYRFLRNGRSHRSRWLSCTQLNHYSRHAYRLVRRRVYFALNFLPRGYFCRIRLFPPSRI